MYSCIYPPGQYNRTEHVLLKQVKSDTKSSCSSAATKFDETVRPLKNRQNKDLNDKLKLNEGRKYCKMLPTEHSAILKTCIKRFKFLKTKFVVFLRVVLDRFDCTYFYSVLSREGITKMLTSLCK